MAQRQVNTQGDVSAFLRGASTRAVAQLLWKGAAFVTAMVIVRILPARGAGTYFFALSTGALCGLLLGLGLFQVLGRDGPRWDLAGSPQTTNRFFRKAVGVIVLAWAGVLLVVLLLVPNPVWLAATGIAGAVAYQTLCSSLFRVRSRPQLAELNQAVVPLTFLGILAIGAIAATGALDTSVVLGFRVLLEISVALLLVIIALRETRRRSNDPLHSVWRSSLLLWMTGVAWIAIEQADVILLGVLRGRAEVAVYAPALRVAEVMTVFFGVVFPYLVVVSSRQSFIGNMDQVQRLCISVNKVGMAVAAPIFALVLIAPEGVLDILFDIQDPDASRAIQILGLALFAHAFLGGTSGLAESLLGTRLLAARSAFALAVTLLADVLLISRWGVPGAAGGTLCGYLSVVTANAFLLSWKKGIRPVARDSALTFVVPLLMVAVASRVDFEARFLWALLLAALVGVVTGLVAWKTARERELVLLRAVLTSARHPRMPS